jgi:hypothetical protein
MATELTLMMREPKTPIPPWDCQEVIRARVVGTYVGNVLEHREQEVEIRPWIEEGLTDLVPLPRIISDALSITANSINCYRFLPLVEPSD